MWQYNYSDDYLAHYGVPGMKWGVRRYRNYDGSYTRAGVKRFDSSMRKYEKANDRYKNAKVNYKISKKQGSSTGGTKTELTNARLQRKQAKNKLNKDYKHLKQDKLGDQGKELYSKGKTITGNSHVTGALAKVGSLSLSAAAYNYKTGMITSVVQRAGLRINNQTVNSVLGLAGIGASAVAGAKGAIDYSQNKKLRAYYGHTSNY